MRADTAPLARAGRMLLDLVYPPRCVGCGAFGAGFLCGVCFRAAREAAAVLHCANCWAPWEGDSFCPACSHWDALDGGRAACRYGGPAKRAVHALKYGHVRAVAAPMAIEVARAAAEFAADFAMAVPLHPSRRRRRGYNQAEEILRASGLAPGPGVLERILKTRTQVGLGLHERRANVRGAFRYRGPELAGLSFVLIDDVITTGATANECARVLKDFGARRVSIAAFARAEPGPAGTGDA
jgi:ComF family protein